MVLHISPVFNKSGDTRSRCAATRESRARQHDTRYDLETDGLQGQEAGSALTRGPSDDAPRLPEPQITLRP